MNKKQISVRIEPEIYKMLQELKKHYQEKYEYVKITQTDIIQTSINVLWNKEIN